MGRAKLMLCDTFQKTAEQRIGRWQIRHEEVHASSQ